jgi:hypothetical protein
MSDWKLTNVIAQWFEEQEWEERPEINEEDETSSTYFGYKTGDFSLKCYFAAAEKPVFFTMYIYFMDTKIPEAKIPEVLKWLNLVNCSYPLGTLHFVHDDRIIRCHHGMDYDDATFETQHISNVFNILKSIMEYRLPQVLAICFGGKTAEEALEVVPEE